jgi:hypothetical protein
VSFSISLPSSFPCAGEIHYPPYEQVLVGMGVGTMGLVQVVLLRGRPARLVHPLPT